MCAMWESYEQEKLLSSLLGLSCSRTWCSPIWSLQNYMFWKLFLSIWVSVLPWLLERNSVTKSGCNMLEPQKGDLRRGVGTLIQEFLAPVSLQCCL